MRINSRLIVLMTLLLSTSYIFGIEYYEKQEETVGKLYEAISLQSITYNEVRVEISGVKEGEVLNTRDILSKQNKFIEDLAHDESCSKLCRTAALAFS